MSDKAIAGHYLRGAGMRQGVTWDGHFVIWIGPPGAEVPVRALQEQGAKVITVKSSREYDSDPSSIKHDVCSCETHRRRSPRVCVQRSSCGGAASRAVA
jgi:hypothetical protein